MSSSIPLDVAHLALNSNAPLTPSKRRRRRRGEFLKGPIPLAWLSAAGRLSGKALAVGIVAWHLAGLTNKRTVKWRSKKAKQMGIERHAAYRALEALENAGLIKVKRHLGRTPIITILDIESGGSDESGRKIEDERAETATGDYRESA